VNPKKKKRPSAGYKSTKKSGLTQVISQIKSQLSEKCHAWHISLDGMTSKESCKILHAHTIGKSAVCPCCGRRSTTVHSHRLRKIQCVEFLDSHTTLILNTRHFVCTNPKCDRRIFAEPLTMTHSYGRHTYEVEKRIRHEALGQTARKASETLAMQHIQIGASTCIRMLRLMGKDNPEVRTSGYVGLDDFAKWKGHKYMCVIVDHYTRQPLAVFDSRYGQEIIDWLKAHPEIKMITRDGSMSYAAIISTASESIMQVSDRFHLMQNLKKVSVEPIKKLLGQIKEKMPYPYPSEEEAYKSIVDAICQMGEKKHRDKVALFYAARRLKDDGLTLVEVAKSLNVTSRKVERTLYGGVQAILNTDQKRAMKAAREIARIVSAGCITPETVEKKLSLKISSRLIHRCLSPLVCQYRPLREEVRLHNKALDEQKTTCTKIRCSTIWKYIVTGKTQSKKLQRLKDTHPEVDHIIQICVGFRKLLHAEEDAPDINDWQKDAVKCKVREIRGFALCIMKDKDAVMRACSTNFSNAILEGTVNKTKAIKRAMFNRANPDVLRAKVLYSGMKWDWNFHPN